MFCVECGKETAIFRNGLCLTCYLKQMQFSQGPAYLDVVMCPRCSSYKIKNTWVDESFDGVLTRQIKAAFTISPELQQVDFKIKCSEQGRVLTCIVCVSGVLEGHTISEQHSLTVRIKHMTCEVCSREAGGYYEAIIQIRSQQRTFSDHELTTFRATVEDMVRQSQESGKRGLFITDIDVKREGLDFFLSEKGTALSIAKRIQEQFGGEFKQSAAAAGMKDSRQLYRMTYLVRVPGYRKGDFFNFDSLFYVLVSIHGSRVRAIELASWQEKVIDGKNILQSRIYGGAELIREMMLISQSKQEIQLMDPKSYATVDVRKPVPKTFTSQSVKTVKLEEQVFLYPDITVKEDI